MFVSGRHALINDYLAALGETLVSNCEADIALSNVCTLVSDKSDVSSVVLERYVSTESLLPDRGGRQQASSVPESGKVAFFRTGDVLVSNIRPYFKKIWRASFEGGCSTDVLVFRAKDASYSSCLYFSLRRIQFFDFVMKGAKGTKMPRGDKKQMMEYLVPSSVDSETTKILDRVVAQMASNALEATRLVELRDVLLSKLMSGEIDVSQVDITQLNNHLTMQEGRWILFGIVLLVQ